MEKREVDQLARDAIESACKKWNTKIKFDQVLIESESIRWLGNGNVEVPLKIDSMRIDLDFQEFCAFMLAELGSEVSVRLDDGKPVLVAVNQAILDQLPQYRFRWRARWIRWLEKAQEIVFNMGIVAIVLAIVLFPIFVAPESSASLLRWIASVFSGAFARFYYAMIGAGECTPPK